MNIFILSPLYSSFRDISYRLSVSTHVPSLSGIVGIISLLLIKDITCAIRDNRIIAIVPSASFCYQFY